MSGHPRMPDYAESASVSVADYLLERDRLTPAESDVIDEVTEQPLRASDVREVVAALVSCRRDLRVTQQARYQTKIIHRLMPADVIPSSYREAACSCGARGKVIDHDAAEVWHVMHVRWPTESAAELATRMKQALRSPNAVTT